VENARRLATNNAKGAAAKEAEAEKKDGANINYYKTPTGVHLGDKLRILPIISPRIIIFGDGVEGFRSSRPVETSFYSSTCTCPAAENDD